MSKFKLTEIDEAVKAWLAGHHIRIENVRSYEARGRADDFTELNLTVIVAGVEEVPVPRLLTDFTEQPTESIPAVDPNRWSTDYGQATRDAASARRDWSGYPVQPGRNPGGQ